MAFGCPNPTVPSVPPDDRLKLRLKLIAEEFLELLEASGYSTTISDGDGLMDTVEYGGGFRKHNLVKMADALADLDYVIEGMRLECGIDGEPIATEVNRSNMAKVGATQREDGKILKPPGWTPPDIAGELRKQGWKE